jgi:hypothetical protein
MTATKGFLITHNLSQFQEPVGHWCGPDGGPSEAVDHGGQIVSSVEAVFEFCEVAWDMLAVDGAVGPCDGALDVAERGVDPFEGWRPSRFWS